MYKLLPTQTGNWLMSNTMFQFHSSLTDCNSLEKGRQDSQWVHTPLSNWLRHWLEREVLEHSEWNNRRMWIDIPYRSKKLDSLNPWVHNIQLPSSIDKTIQQDQLENRICQLNFHRCRDSEWQRDVGNWKLQCQCTSVPEPCFQMQRCLNFHLLYV